MAQYRGGVVVIAVVLAHVVSTASDGWAGPESAAPATAPSSPPGNSTTIALIEPGHAPLHVLRFAPKVGGKQTAILTMTIGLDAEGSSLPALTAKLTIESSIVGSTAEGNTIADVEVTRAEAVSISELNPQMLQGARKAAAEYVGVAARVTRTPRGQVDVQRAVARDSRKPPSKLPPQVWGMLGIPLPEEPVGTGARWSAVVVVGGGMTTRARTTYELVSLRGRKLRVKTAMEMAADPDAQAVDLPSGERLQPLTYTGSSAGDLTIDLERLQLEAATSTASTHAILRVTKDGHVHNQLQDTSLAFKLESH